MENLSNCIYCGQSAIVKEDEVKQIQKDCKRRLDLLGMSAEIYSATMKCSCGNAKLFAESERQIAESQEAIEELLQDNPQIEDTVKELSELVAYERIRNVSFNYDKYKIAIKKKTDCLEITKEHKVKETKNII